MTKIVTAVFLLIAAFPALGQEFVVEPPCTVLLRAFDADLTETSYEAWWRADWRRGWTWGCRGVSPAPCPLKLDWSVYRLDGTRIWASSGSGPRRWESRRYRPAGLGPLRIDWRVSRTDNGQTKASGVYRAIMPCVYRREFKDDFETGNLNAWSRIQ